MVKSYREYRDTMISELRKIGPTPKFEKEVLSRWEKSDIVETSREGVGRSVRNTLKK